MGDLLEEWHARPSGLRRNLWYSLEALRVSVRYLFVPRRLPGVRHRGASSPAVVRAIGLAIRGLRRDPAVSAVAVFSLALGIASLTTVWAAVDVLVLRPFSFDPEGSLILVGTSVEGRGNPGSPSTLADFHYLREQSRTLDVAAYHEGGATLGGDPAIWTSVRRASGDFFDVVGVQPVLGRAFTPEDERPEAPEVVVLDHGLWERRFGSDPSVLGRTVSVDGAPATVVGVLPRGFQFSRGAPDLWLPLRTTGVEADPGRTLYVFGRARGGHLEPVQAELKSVSAFLAAERGVPADQRVFLSGRLRETLNGSPTRQQGVAAVLLASLAVLLIACANVASVLLARGAERIDDLTLRMALGAGRWRIAGQLLTEALVLATCAGLFSIVLSAVGMRGLATLLPPELPRAGDVALDGRGAAIALGAAWISVLVFSLVPTVRTLRAARWGQPLATSGGQGRGAGRGRLQSVIVSTEIALAMVLVATTTAVVRSLSAIRALETGYATEAITAFDLTLPENLYPTDAAVLGAVARLEQAIAAIPGVETGGVGVGLPGRSWRSLTYRLPGDDGARGGGERIGGGSEALPSVMARFASPGYLATLGVEVVGGRPLTAGDDAGSTHVGLVNGLFAERLWPGGDPVGATLVVDGRPVEIVGVVPNLREQGPFGSPAAVYLPLAQWPRRALSVVARAPSRVSDARELAREIARRADPSLAPHGVASLETVLFLAADMTSALAKVLVVLSGVAVALALGGVFGAMAYSVSRRTPEFGVRLAVGAAPANIRRMVLRRAALVCGAGLAVGVPLALVAARGLRFFLFGVDAAGASTFIGSALAVLGVGLLAAWLPARRASAVDAMRSLRCDT